MTAQQKAICGLGNGRVGACLACLTQNYESRKHSDKSDAHTMLGSSFIGWFHTGDMCFETRKGLLCCSTLRVNCVDTLFEILHVLCR